MIIPVKEKIFNLLRRRILVRNKQERLNPSFFNAKKIGLIYTWEGDLKREAIDDFIKVMEISGKEVSTACFYRSLKNITPYDDDLVVTRKDFKLFGGIKSEEAINFIDQKFDFLFHLDLNGNIFIENMLARCNACCRVGRYEELKKDYYDFMIEVGSDKKIEKLCEEMLKYTKLLVTYD